MIQKWYMDSPLGMLVFCGDEKGLCQLHLADHWNPPELPLVQTPLLLEAERQLREYFSGNRQQFQLPLSLQGTPFQQSIWKVLQTIPYGTTWSYRALATAIGNEKACRAAGSANGKNPVMIIVPCHRVIAADGRLGGYSGGLDVKRNLLKLENTDSPF